ncbi:hypothetical protein BA1379B_004170 [Bartonella sp. A1379B]|uniref:Uncharacterized protein n=1 Tax=Bartonella rochalimae ATCC BAA-1498 TaxID=685782 RepID=E6YM44_9HYPH|nr:hypothetical protein BA1379B_004170 [Bartonella sp. A1379B]AQX22770.1 hypothetical protein Bho11B_007570 [Bartonella sp. 11B]AQX23943.1 hypothetical protein Bho114_006150 [Bartonella sp. 114]AQX25220.1 hypothetical protein Bco22_005320 [Bartonella sp. Coyote22sub2]KEC56924.1 hypothetical protein O99_00346 [Bartonella rochalimae ATCC BAA-1498]
MAVILTFESFKSVVKIDYTVGEFSEIRFSDMEEKKIKNCFLIERMSLMGLNLIKLLVLLMNVHGLSLVEGNT